MYCNDLTLLQQSLAFVQQTVYSQRLTFTYFSDNKLILAFWKVRLVATKLLRFVPLDHSASQYVLCKDKVSSFF